MKKSIFLDYLFEFPNFLSLFIFNFLFMATSPILLDISNYFNVPPGNMNLIITIFMGGVVIGILTSIFFNRKFKKIQIILVAYFMTIPILVGLSLTKILVVFHVLYSILGYLFGLIWVSANSNMMEGKVKNKDSVVNLGLGLSSIGALIAPFLSTSLINRQLSWKIIYYMIIFMVLVAIFLYLITNNKKSNNTQSRQKKTSIIEVFKYKNKNIFLLLSGIMILFYTTSEAIIFAWAPTFFRIQKMFNLSDAGFIISVFWIGMVIGRLSISFLSYRLNVKYIMIGSSLTGIIALIFTIFSDNIYISFIAMSIVGLSFSGLAPLILSTTSTVYDYGKDIIITIIIFLALSGNAIGPYLTKLISGNNMIFSLAITIFLMCVVLIFTLTRVFYKKNFIK